MTNYLDVSSADFFMKMLTHIEYPEGLIKKIAENMPESGMLDVKINVNGVDLPGDTFEKTLSGIYDQVENFMRNRYDAENIERMIDEKAQGLLTKEAEKIMDKMHNILYELEVIEACGNSIREGKN